ncbi:MAG: sigma 54-interacting transcriptional regulator [Pseudomonadota bacterium]|nr:sigma 54-interacting transcriptional regulator [Pseudomonadota bacterium]
MQPQEQRSLSLACIGTVGVDAKVLRTCFAAANYRLSVEKFCSFNSKSLQGKDFVLFAAEGCDADMVAVAATSDAWLIIVGEQIELEALLTLIQQGVADVLPSDSSTEAIATYLLSLLASKVNPANLYRAAIGETMQGVVSEIESALQSEIRAIHLHGETGTGKEVAAQALAHLVRPNKLVSINCAAIQVSLQASLLFGHRRGAFTDATEDRAGLIAQADGGWLFLDELACLHADVQAALLRILENGEYMRVGESRPRHVDVKILSATNKPIPACVEEGQFRGDLWQRLREMEIYLPPLRARRTAEIKELIAHFLQDAQGTGSYRMSSSAAAILLGYDWSGGNVRELRNCLRSMTSKDSAGMLTVRSLPSWLLKNLHRRKYQLDIRGAHIFQEGYSASFAVLTQMLLLKCIEENFQRYGRSSVRQLAKRLSLAPNTLARKLNSLVDSNQVSRAQLNTYVRIQGN